MPDEIVPNSRVFIRGQNPGAQEVVEGRPFCGQTGQIMESTFFPLANLVRGENVSIGNTFRCRLGATNDVPDTATLRAAALHCAAAHERIPASVEMVVAQGSVAWQFETQRADLSIGDWRGHLAPERGRLGVPVYAVLHLADLNLGRQPEMTLPSKLDWARIPRILDGTHPRQFPPRLQVGPFQTAKVNDWFRAALEHAPYLVWDTEFRYTIDDPYRDDNHQLTMVSITYPGADQGIQFVKPPGETDMFEQHFIEEFEKLCKVKRHVGHNFTAEIRCMEKSYGWNPAMFWGRFDDSMHAHAEVWSEHAHTLEFLESLYSPYPKMKHLPTTDPLRNWGDTVVTLEVWQAVERELSRDADALRNYREQRLALCRHIYTRESKGLKVNKARVEPAIRMYQSKIDAANVLAQAYCGYGINLNASTQVAYWLYDVEQLTVQKSKNKHTKTKRSTDKDAIAALRASVLPFDGDYEANTSITQEYVQQRLADGAHPLLEAKVLFTEAEQIQSHYLNPLMKGGSA